MPCNPYTMKSSPTRSRTSDAGVRPLIRRLYGDAGVEEFKAGTKGGVIPEGGHELYDGLSKTFNDDWVKNQVRPRNAVERSHGYIRGLHETVQKAVMGGQFGAAQIRDIAEKMLSSLTPDSRAALGHSFQEYQRKVAASHPVLKKLADQSGGIPDAHALLEAGVPDELIAKLAPSLESAKDLGSYVAGAIVDRSTIDMPKEVFDDLNLKQFEGSGLQDFIDHGKRVVNVASDAFEARYGTSEGQRAFSKDSLNSEYKIIDPRMTSTAKAAIEHFEANSPLAPIFKDSGIDPIVAVRLDLELRANPNKPVGPEKLKLKKGPDGQVKANAEAARRGQILSEFFEKGSMNFEHFTGPNDVLRLQRMMEQLSGIADSADPLDAQDVRAYQMLQDIVDPADPNTYKLHLMNSADEVTEGARMGRSQLRMGQWLMVGHGRHVVNLLNEYRLGNLGEEGIKRLAQKLIDFDQIRDSVSRFRSEWGRTGRTLREDITGGPGLHGDAARDVRDIVLDAEKAEGADKFRREFGGPGNKEKRPTVPELADAEVEAPEVANPLLEDALLKLGEDPNPERAMANLKKFLDELADNVNAKKTSAEQLAYLSKMNRAALSAGPGKILNEWRYGSMLSSLKTPVVNLLGTASAVFARPTAMMIGSAFRGDTTAFRRATNETMMLFTEFKESFKYAAEAWRVGARLEPNKNLEGFVEEGAISTANEAFAKFEGSLTGNFINWLGKGVRTPGRVLQATDDAFKQIQYRTTFRAEIAERMVAEGATWDEAWRKAHDVMERNHRDGQAYGFASVYKQGLALADQQPNVTPGMRKAFARQYANQNYDKVLGQASQRSVDVAKQVTFQTDLRPNTLPRLLSDAAQRNWLLRLAVPFVRTPTNILYTTFQHFDVLGTTRYLYGKSLKSEKGMKKLAQSHNKFIQDMMSEGPGSAARKAEAVGRMSLGLSASAFIGMASYQGLITGGGPADERQRKVMEASGWQPYSIRTPEGYVSYERFDPAAGIMGMSADFFEYISLNDHVDEHAMEVGMTAFATAISSNLDNKTYLTGLMDFMSAIGEPKEHAEKVFSTSLGSFIPAIINDVSRATDDNEREIKGWVDSLRKRIPGLGIETGRKSLPIMRNMFGEPVDTRHNIVHGALGEDSAVGNIAGMFVPIAYSSVSDNVVDQEFEQLGKGFAPPSSRRGGIDLRAILSEDGETDAYDRWMEIQGDIEIDGLGIRDALKTLIQSEDYQQLSPESDDEVESPRLAKLRRIIGLYRDASFRQLQEEFPEVRDRLTERKRRQRAAVLGVDISQF